MTPARWFLVLLVFPCLRQGAWFDGVLAIHGLMHLGAVRSLDFVCIVRSRDFPKCLSLVCFRRSSQGWFHGMHSLCFLCFGGSSLRARGLGSCLRLLRETVVHSLFSSSFPFCGTVSWSDTRVAKTLLDTGALVSCGLWPLVLSGCVVLYH